MELKVIAYAENGYDEKFGIPRQPGLAPSVLTRIVFTPDFRDEAALREIEQYSHLWLLWQFSEVEQDGWSPTVRPPRLGGNKRVGVFASRSPFRPNPIGLSVVKLERLEKLPSLGMTLLVSGADLKNGTPIFDIKPYLAYVDAVPEATNGFAEATKNRKLQVVWNENIHLDAALRTQLTELLALDPRPGYQDDDERLYGMSYQGLDVRFKVKNETIFVENINKK